MNKKKLARMIGVCIMAIMIIVVITILPSCQSQTPTLPKLVTYNCTGQRVSSLRGQGEVTDIGAGLLSRRGFVWLEGDSGDPALNLVPLVNPSFEYGDPPSNWTVGQAAILSRETTIVKTGSASMKIVSNGTWCRAVQNITNYADYAGKRVLFYAWYYCPSTNDKSQRITISDGVGEGYSAYLTKNDTWQWITAALNVSASPTILQMRLASNYGSTSDYDDVLYIDGVILVLGDAVLEDGEFGTGTYSLTIGGLKPDTSYRVRAFGENEAGIGYGNTVTCKTLAG